MNGIRPKYLRLRLDCELYDQLRNRVLRRDSWRCQSCGTMSNLEVHHKRFRSQSGDDSEPNLITLCNECHAAMHDGSRSPESLTHQTKRRIDNPNRALAIKLRAWKEKVGPAFCEIAGMYRALAVARKLQERKRSP